MKADLHSPFCAVGYENVSSSPYFWLAAYEGRYSSFYVIGHEDVFLLRFSAHSEFALMLLNELSYSI
jgi:hypothetical protein